MWQYDLIVDGDGGANPSLQIAEALGTNTRRKQITSAQFAPLIALFEPQREYVERRLSQFEDDNMSWRDYAGYSFDDIPKEIESRAIEILSGLG